MNVVVKRHVCVMCERNPSYPMYLMSFYLLSTLFGINTHGGLKKILLTSDNVYAIMQSRTSFFKFSYYGSITYKVVQI